MDFESEIMSQVAAYVENDLMVSSRLLSDPELFGLQNEATRNPNFYEEIIAAYSDEEFRQHFRMSRECFSDLLRKVETVAGRTDLEKKLLFTVWMLAKQESFLSAGDRFNLAKSSAHLVFMEIVEIINDLTEQYVKWPARNEYENISNCFQEKSNGKIPGIIGAIDGCHIQMKQPKHNPVDYYNRKNTHSIILQAVCDHRTVFTDVCVGAPGRLHDGRVFRISELCSRITDLIPPEFHLVGESAYPLSTSLQTPFRDNGHLTAAQSRFNTSLSSARVTIERAFGFLKGRFRRLKYLDVATPDTAVKMVVAAVVLHNHIMLYADENEPLNEQLMATADDVETPEVSSQNVRNRSAGEVKRNALLRAFQNEN